MTTDFDVDLCLHMHSDCNADPGGFANLHVAQLVHRHHAGHGPRCLQGLAAGSYISEAADDSSAASPGETR
ncbi:hypothetical protein [Nocardia asiatica]|uniref:hypothetical protein n=1 Tax=Nocardia asiatica TaxID=209252 RepID=UPI0002D89FCD|nr:hypothetical protein [Nocardia asiatica]